MNSLRMITTTGNWNVVIWKAIEKTITAQHLGMDNNNQQRTDSQLYKIAFDCYVKNMLFFSNFESVIRLIFSACSGLNLGDFWIA